MTAGFGRMAKALPVAVLAATGVIAAGASALASTSSSGAAALGAGFNSRLFASAASIVHTTPKGKVAISQPDDIASLRGHIFVGFQNGVGAQGEPSTTGNTDSTVVEFSLRGHAVHQWDVVGKCDGLVTDPATGRVIATVNEDAHSSIYVISGSTAVHYRYSRALPSRGGTDSLTIYHGMVLTSASAPGTTGSAAPSAKYPAVYRITFDAKTHVATIHALLSDEASATVANTNSSKHGKPVRLALTDPDSTEEVPAYAGRFAGDFMLTGQGDLEQIYVAGAGTSHQTLSVLKLSDSVDDTVWPSGGSGAIYTLGTASDAIDKVTGPFKRGSVFVAGTPCNANSAPSTCPGPGFTANYLGELTPTPAPSPASPSRERPSPPRG